LTTVGRTVSALQSMIRDKRNPDEIAFPPELELAREDSAPAEEPPPAPATEEPAAPQPPPAPLPVAGPPEPAPEAPPPPTAPARPPAESASSQPDADARASPTQLAGKYLTFRLAAEEFGIEILRVQEIIKLLDITRVPRTPDFIRGVINLRGKVIPVIDLRIKFGMPAQAATDKTCIVVVQVKRGESILTVGIIVDEVSEVLEVAAAEIEPPPAFGAAVDTAFILGMAKTRGAVRILLDISRVLTEGASGQ